MDRFGEKLRLLRQRRKLSQKALGDALGFSRERVSSLERGKELPPAKLVVKIADLFGVTTDVLMRDELDV